MTEQQFRQLLQRYRENTLSEEDWSLLRNALHDGLFDDALEKDIQHVFHTAAETADASDQAHSPEAPLSEEQSPSISPVRRLRWAAAAAAILLLWVTGSYLYSHSTKKEKPHPAIAAAPAAIQPGGNKAFLLLANGHQITLDEAEKGTVAHQGNIDVIKADSGLLTYHTGKEQGHDLMYNTVITPRGGQFQLVLSDGTKVWLNAASSLRFPTSFSGNERVVELTGEGYFEVKHNSAMPFRVKANKQIIEDLGTAFNINAYDDEPIAHTTLVEGAAKVIGGNTIDLHPGQQARMTADGTETLTSNVNLEEILAWKNGKIAFTNADFPELMRQIARWYDIDVHYDGTTPKARFFAILNRNISLHTIIEYLQKNGVNIRQTGRTLFIQP